MPSIAWKMITASASTLIFHAPGRFRPIAENSGKRDRNAASNDDHRRSPWMYKTDADGRKHRTATSISQLRAALAPAGQQREHQHQHAERASEKPMHLLAPCLVRFIRAIRERRIGMRHRLRMLRPGHLAVTGRPVRTGQPGIGQPHERAEHHQSQREHRRQQRQATQDFQQTRRHHLITFCRSLRSPEGSKPAGYSDSAVPSDSTSKALTLSGVVG
jgi:hypothetical protein